ITTTQLPSGTVGTAYPTTRLTATGGTSPLAWSATGLPTGLSINPATGDIGGTPGAGGSFTVNVQVSDSSGQTTSAQFTLVIVLKLQITTTSLPPGAIGANYATRLNASGGISPLRWSATGLPGGLLLNQSTGDITGAPTIGGSFTVSVTVTDSSTP